MNDVTLLLQATSREDKAQEALFELVYESGSD